jgi:hypothetical protein
MILPSHAASVPRPAVHGTVGFSAPARRRWYFAPVPRHSGSAFKPLSRHSLAVETTDGCGIPRSALTRYRPRRTGTGMPDAPLLCDEWGNDWRDITR